MLQGPESPRAPLRVIHEPLRGWQECDVVVRNQTRDGAYFWSHLVIVPIANERGWFTHWLSIQRNVTAVVEFLEALKVERRVLSATLATLPVAPAVLDAEGRVMRVNEAWRASAGAQGIPDAGLWQSYRQVLARVLGMPSAKTEAALANALRFGPEERLLPVIVDGEFAGQRYRLQLVEQPRDEYRLPTGCVVTHTHMGPRDVERLP